MKTANGAISIVGNICLMRTASASVMKQETMFSMLSLVPIGADRKHWSIGVNNDFAGIKSWFIEYYARDTSRKIRAVQKAKGERGIPLTVNVPYGYLKDPDNPQHWIMDPVAADVVKRTFNMCMEGRGTLQIAKQLKADKVLTPTTYKETQGINSPNKRSENPYAWQDSTVVHILERMEYTGCTVNFKTYTNFIWDKKQRDNPIEKQSVFPNTHERIIEDDVFKRGRKSCNRGTE